MKRYGNIYEKIYDIENLRQAHKNARKDKLFYREVMMIDNNVDYCLSKVSDMIKNNTYKVCKEDYTISKINDKGKERELWKLPYYPHRIIQWAIMLQIEDIFKETFTNFTCASIPNRGIHYAQNLVNKYLNDEANTKYCLKIDINKFYPSINHEILKKMLRKKINDSHLLSLLDMIIDSCPPKGIPIGSYLSQYLANFYLAYFDHWLKEELKIKYVVRYMDDIVILGRTKEELHSDLKRMKSYISQNLDLKIKDNWQVFPTDIRGIDFVGYRFFRKFTLLRKRTYKKFKRTMKNAEKYYNRNGKINHQIWCSINSYNGWLKWCDSFRLKQKYMTKPMDIANKYYLTNVKNKHEVKS